MKIKSMLPEFLCLIDFSKMFDKRKEIYKMFFELRYPSKKVILFFGGGRIWF